MQRRVWGREGDLGGRKFSRSGEKSWWRGRRWIQVAPLDSRCITASPTENPAPTWYSRELGGSHWMLAPAIDARVSLLKSLVGSSAFLIFRLVSLGR